MALIHEFLQSHFIAKFLKLFLNLPRRHALREYDIHKTLNHPVSFTVYVIHELCTTDVTCIRPS